MGGVSVNPKGWLICIQGVTAEYTGGVGGSYSQQSALGLQNFPCLTGPHTRSRLKIFLGMYQPPSIMCELRWTCMYFTIFSDLRESNETDIDPLLCVNSGNGQLALVGGHHQCWCALLDVVPRPPFPNIHIPGCRQGGEENLPFTLTGATRRKLCVSF